jgi:proline iminopeptidase
VDARTDLSTNTTDRLLADLEKLRVHLGIERWLLQGTSWGVTLALVYAETYPERVTAMVLTSVTMTRPGDIHWLYHETGRYYPQAWEQFRAGVPASEQDGDLVASYFQLLHGPTGVTTREKAARAWCDWEDAASPMPDGGPNPRYADHGFRMTLARIVTHYFHHRAWLSEDQILGNARRLAGIPAALIHGRFDLGSPIDAAWQLARAWPDAELQAVNTGHTGGESMTSLTIEATDRFAVRR